MIENKRSPIDEYVDEVREQFVSGHAKEHAYRPALQKLMSSFDDVVAVNDPKRSEHGNPDFAFLKRSNQKIILGYAEAKDVTVDLDKTEKSEQLQRYSGYGKLFLTNYLDFRFFKNGEKYREICIGMESGTNLSLRNDQFDILQNELKSFLALPPEKIKSGQRLAEIMGGKARRIRDSVQEYLVDESQGGSDELKKIFEMMRKLLVHDLTPSKFADMYAQTLIYGLFVARYNDETPEAFSRAEARDLVPASNPFLREFFDHIVGPHFDKRLGYIVDELCEVFSVSDVREIVHKHLKVTERSGERDPIIHFYEDFLKEYDPAERKKMGAYYTPIPVVKFIVRHVDKILKEEFGLTNGLSDTSKKIVTVQRQAHKVKAEMHQVQILDPAVGTATFLNEIINHIYAGFKGQEGRWPSYVNDDLVPRLHGFELMMAPYTIAHLKLGMTLAETGVNNLRERLGVYLTNTLEEGVNHELNLFSFGLAEVVSHEAEAASDIKHERPIMVVVGNPPYSGESSNKTKFAMNLVEKYKVEPGGLSKLKERNPKWINDDYVKFIAFAEEMIAKNGTGIMAMITNHGYLDNPTFRGMRWQLTQTFDAIYVFDLHGNSKKKEIGPDGGKDENVFDIQQGVAIILAVKTSKKRTAATVFHSELFGTRKEKFHQLHSDPVWTPVKLDSRFYYFNPHNTKGKTEYEKGIPINELFRVSSVGIVTARDKMSIQFTRKKVEDVVVDFKQLEAEELRHKYDLGKDVRDWSVKGAKQDVEREGGKIVPIAYRPFDVRYTYYTGNSRGFHCYPRSEVMKHFVAGKNVGLMLCRQQRTKGFHHALVHEDIVESSYVSNRTSEIGTTFPLYLLYEDGTQTPNLDRTKLKELVANLDSEPTPEEVLHFIYAVLHSKKYREKYQEFLKTDFPRVPIPKNTDEFQNLAKYGKMLCDLHLLRLSNKDVQSTTYSVAGSDRVERVEHINDQVFINETQYFGNVPTAAWEFCVGAYQPAQKWLKDRKGSALTSEDIEYYQKIIEVIGRTITVMKQIDE